MNRIDPDLLNRAQERFFARGETVAGWARERGFDPGAVYQVLSGRCKCKRGVAHTIAVALGLKPAVTKNNPDEQALTSTEVHM